MQSHGRELAGLKPTERFIRLAENSITSLRIFAFKGVKKNDGLEDIRDLIAVLTAHQQALKKLLALPLENTLSLSQQSRPRREPCWADEQFKEHEACELSSVSLAAIIEFMLFYDCYVRIRQCLLNHKKIELDDASKNVLARGQKIFLQQLNSITCDVLPGFTAAKLHEDYAASGPIIQKEFLNPNVKRLQEILGIATFSVNEKGLPSVAGHFSSRKRSQRQSVHEMVVRRRDSTIFST